MIQEYINEETVINDDIYKAFNDSVICQICKNIIIEPMMCMHCQNVYCRQCINKWRIINAKCPLRCINPNYQISHDIAKILSNLKFKCKNCNNIFNYNDMKNHLTGCKILTDYKNFFGIDEDIMLNGIFKKMENKENIIFESKDKIKSKNIQFNIIFYFYSNYTRSKWGRENFSYI